MKIVQAEYDGKVQFVFSDGGKEIGEISLIHVPGGFEVSNVLVWPQFQRKGYATRFYRHAWEFAHGQGKKLFRSDDRTDDAKALHTTFRFDGREIVFESRNVYEPMDLDALRQTIEGHGPLYSETQSGFEADPDGAYAVVFWRNVGTDETMHRDVMGPLKKHLNRNGYESKTTKPAHTTLIVRKVQPYVAHGSARGSGVGPFESVLVTTRSLDMGPFESMVEAKETGRIPPAVRTKINDYLSDIGQGPQLTIPLTKIDQLLRKYGFLLVSEDGTPWSGFLLGRDGRANIDIGVLSSDLAGGTHEIVGNAMLVLTWHKYETGGWEIVAYVS